MPRSGTAGEVPGTFPEGPPSPDGGPYPETVARRLQTVSPIQSRWFSLGRPASLLERGLQGALERRRALALGARVVGTFPAVAGVGIPPYAHFAFARRSDLPAGPPLPARCGDR